jgi:hypothetical protein
MTATNHKKETADMTDNERPTVNELRFEGSEYQAVNSESGADRSGAELSRRSATKDNTAKTSPANEAASIERDPLTAGEDFITGSPH